MLIWRRYGRLLIGRLSLQPGNSRVNSRAFWKTRLSVDPPRQLVRICRHARLYHQEKWLTAKAAVGFFAANSQEDDIIVQNGKETLTTVHCLRQQMEKPPGRPNYSLADFVAPLESGKQDYIGMFASDRRARSGSVSSPF